MAKPPLPENEALSVIIKVGLKPAEAQALRTHIAWLQENAEVGEATPRTMSEFLRGLILDALRRAKKRQNAG